MEQLFKNKNIIITGGASGIGASLTARLRGYGARVIVIGRTSRPSVKDYIQADMANFEEAKRAFDQAVTEMNQIDYMINSAGIFMGGEVRDTPVENWHKVIDNNIYAIAHGSHLAYQQMVHQGNGHIINISSAAGLFPVPAMGIYGATKYALVGLSHEMRNEGAALGVKVSVACPTIVDTPLYETALYNNMDKRRILQSRRKLQTAEVAADKILKGIQRNQATIHTSVMTVGAWSLYRILPRVYDAIARRIIRRYRSGLRAEKVRK